MKTFNITEKEELESVIKGLHVCYVGMVDGDKPYVLPFNFGYKDDVIYIHSGKYPGHKLDVLSKNNNVTIVFNTDNTLSFVDKDVACSYTMRSRCVIVEGKLEMIEDFDEKIAGLNILMKQYTGKDTFNYSKPAIDGVNVMKIVIEKISGRKRGVC